MRGRLAAQALQVHPRDRIPSAAWSDIAAPFAVLSWREGNIMREEGGGGDQERVRPESGLLFLGFEGRVLSSGSRG